MAACEPEMWTSLRLSEGSEGKEDGGDDVFILGSGLSLPAGAPSPLTFILKGSGVTRSGIMSKAPSLCWSGLVRPGQADQARSVDNREALAFIRHLLYAHASHARLFLIRDSHSVCDYIPCPSPVDCIGDWQALTPTPWVPHCENLRIPETAFSLAGARILRRSQGAGSLVGGRRVQFKQDLWGPRPRRSVCEAQNPDAAPHPKGNLHLFASGLDPVELWFSSDCVENSSGAFKMQVQGPTLTCVCVCVCV